MGLLPVVDSWIVLYGKHPPADVIPAARAPGEIRSVGLELLLLAEDGRIREDYQFVEPAA